MISDRVPSRRPAAALLLIVCWFSLHSVRGESAQSLDPREEAAPSPGPAWVESADGPFESSSELAIAAYAKVLCSAVFVSHRTADEAARNSAYFLIPRRDRNRVSYTIDRVAREIRAELSKGPARIAKFYGDQGCIILPRGHHGVFFEPVAVTTLLPDSMTLPWPMGDAPIAGAAPRELDERRLDSAIDVVFAEERDLTTAFLAVYQGRIVAERYAHGVGRDSQLESWSMGKSLTATLIGLLIQQGHLSLDDRAPVPAWSAPDDPRSGIRIVDLMHMSSGLRFSSPHDPDYAPEAGYPDHLYVYSGAVDAFAYSYNRPLQYAPNTEGRYRNCDPLVLGYIVKRVVAELGENYLTYPQRALFDRIGIRRQVLETDPYGNFLLTGHDYGTARNWARLGLLYLQDGLWLGERLLPEGWSAFVSSPAPAWREPVYGGLFWLNRDGAHRLPRDTYYMSGAGGQRTFIVPSLDLVIVRMGHVRGDTPAMRSRLNEALGLIAESIGPGPQRATPPPALKN